MSELLYRIEDPRNFVDASTIDILDEELHRFWGDWSHNGLFDVRPEGAAAVVLCSQEIGYPRTVAELWSGPPPLRTDGWQDVVEMSVHWPTEVMDVGGEGTSLDEDPLLPIPGPGDYRIRVSGRNRDDGDVRREDDPVEEYLIQVWQAPSAPPVTHKATSVFGAYRRAPDS